MWKLIYEDTFGFGEDRDPPKIEKTGDDGRDGFFQLWTNVLREGLSIPHGGKPAPGFARFSLLIDLPDEKGKYVSIDVRKYIKGLAALKQEENTAAIMKISADHYDACLRNEEESFWNNFQRQKESFKVYAVNIGKGVYIKRMILSVFLLVIANALFLFCSWSAYYLLSLQRTTEAIISGVFAVVFLFINVSFLNIKKLHMRYKQPEKFYIEIDNANFTHSDGDFVRKIDRDSITDISEKEILSRGGLRILIIVDYSENGKKTSYSFFRAFSKRDIVYNITAEELNAHR